MKTQRLIVSDANCIILFSNINRLEILHKLYSIVTITSIVASEINEKLPDWIEILDAKESLCAANIIIETLDAGKFSAIKLVLEYPGSLLLIDETTGRNAAQKLGLLNTGSLGLLLSAKIAEIVSLLSSLIEEIKRINFRYSDRQIEYILQQAGER